MHHHSEDKGMSK